MDACIKELYRIGIVPVVALEDAADALPLGAALKKGGVSAIEVTFRTAAAADAIRLLSREMPELLVGAGTVITKAQADAAIEAGAKFIVSPGFQPELVSYVLSKGVPMCPGTATPGEMEQAMALGLSAVKFFPAEQNGGAPMLKALSAPYRDLLFMPTGGVKLENLRNYLALDQVFACGGTWLATKDDIKAKAFDKITARTREAVKTMLNFRIKHVGINSKDEAEAKKTATLLCSIFDFDYNDTELSVFTGTAVEVMKFMGRGSLGHVAIGADNVDRAEYYLRQRGFSFDESTRRVDAAGRTTFLYLSDEIGGFAFHLTKN
ncbi:bifunctional 4-hydroxy-2-oxoglutarate aldolase/2-dehydro-3-deoxy-phosphogluconate aldolase [Stomatobaculum sp. F0698]|jgi:2-dehydro-3-deoxyphosphogluconate aldolase/4-hydroxy-2-oxoglutarate aldolase|uniref:bifunctional 4-hydroxy-2-oxoglutarate aldolase/2-dehydro-3-deoxy-phosphogluconate aldolase n=1 Tax=Stomatobaculum sp. F0698 TaxID=3059030 RepID=UPI00272D4190|nr:bifunctional 4-hydroxy-2-oxoglutarate aldolase/2-dehydro-3-deoxy-phosphogluconate aldolase [Stomatobaculum sp. F0698]WLD87046.1 bifunctional 4-hydroxy-2-oxoglutarate aldolase/2-dehydro-3-deoxy-phosphogluconate aldolase [Stomatobaculum sp. F0698]